MLINARAFVLGVRRSQISIKLIQCKFSSGVTILPTSEQALKCVYLCQALTTVYRPIYMVRLDERMGKIFIIAGNDIEILISRDGNWEYL